MQSSEVKDESDLISQLTRIRKIRVKRGSILDSEEDRNLSELYSEAD